VSSSTVAADQGTYKVVLAFDTASTNPILTQVEGFTDDTDGCYELVRRAHGDSTYHPATDFLAGS
jgi:hypothetical protein